MRIYKKLFGKRLKLAISARGFSHEEFASQMGVSPPSLHRWVAGDSFPKEEAFERMLVLLNIQPDFFLLTRDLEARLIAALISAVASLNKVVETQDTIIKELRSQLPEEEKPKP